MRVNNLPESLPGSVPAESRISYLAVTSHTTKPHKMCDYFFLRKPYL